MKKQGYLREDAHRWRCISKDIAGGQGVHGFEAIDGFSLHDLYAVGWLGEVWHYNGNTWQQKNVVTPVILTDVCCGGDLVYAIGRENTFVTGRGDSWTVKQLDLPVDLLSICWFQGALYAASARDIFKLNEHSTFEPVVIESDYPATCGKLALGTNSMLSAGERDWFTFDGTNWKRID